jgi:hypothetical protein
LRQVAVSIHLLGLTLLSVGKWVYEVLISSQGLMQIGWCTINCRFNQEVHTREGALPKRVFCCRRPQNSSQSHSGACLIRAAPPRGWTMPHSTQGHLVDTSHPFSKVMRVLG